VLKSRRLVSLAAVGLSLAALAACSTTRMLNTDDVQSAISTGLTEQLGGTYTVACPSDIEAKTGGTFTCTVTDPESGQTAEITGTQTDDQGKFSWEITSTSDAGSASPAPSAS
jgi:hypothetical protein